MPEIFVNFRTGDETFAAVLIDEKMVEWFGPQAVFRDSRSIPLGEEFTRMLWSKLAESKILLAVIGKRWLTLTVDGVQCLRRPDDYVRREIAYALRHGIRVVPVLIEDTTMPRADQLPAEIAQLATHQYIRVYPRNAHRDLTVLAGELSALLGVDARPPARSPEFATVAPDATYLVVATKIEGFSSLSDAAQIGARQAVYDLLHAAATSAGLDWSELGRADRVDGSYLLVPEGDRPASVVQRLVDSLAAALGQHDLRLRMAVHCGRASRDAAGWAGSALLLAGQLADAEAATRVFTHADRCRLVVIASDDFFQRVVRQGRHGLDPSRFGPVPDQSPAGWMWAVGYARPPGVRSTPPAPPPHPDPAPATPSRGPVFMGPIVGPVNTGDGPQQTTYYGPVGR